MVFDLSFGLHLIIAKAVLNPWMAFEGKAPRGLTAQRTIGT